MLIEKKQFDFELKKISKSENKEIGYFSGFVSTPDLDKNRDIVNPAAFIAWYQRVKDRSNKNKKIKILFNHDENKVIGGVPINNIKISDRGLEIVDAELILTVPQAKEVYDLMKHEILDSMSFGFITLDSIKKSNGEREIIELDVFEISVVTIPANNEALITEVKNASIFKNFPLADRKYPWDSSEAIKRVRKFLKSTEYPSNNYKNAFFYYDKENYQNFGSYKLPFVDVIDGKLKAVPRAIIAAASVIEGARGGIKGISEEDRKKISDHINMYYKKMGMVSPIDGKAYDSKENIETEMKEEKMKRKILAGNDKRNMATKNIEIEIERDDDEDEEYENDILEYNNLINKKKILKEKLKKKAMEDIYQDDDIEIDDDYEDDYEDDKRSNFKNLKTLKEIRKSLKAYGISSEKAKDLTGSILNAYKSMVKRKKMLEEDTSDNEKNDEKDDDKVHIDNYVLTDGGEINEEGKDEVELSEEEKKIKEELKVLLSKVESLKNKM